MKLNEGKAYFNLNNIAVFCQDSNQLGCSHKHTSDKWIHQNTCDHWNHLNPLQISFILYLSDYRDLKINDWYVYPKWALVLGWMMTVSSTIMVPLWVVIHLCSTTGSFREVCVHPKPRVNTLLQCLNNLAFMVTVLTVHSSVWLLAVAWLKIQPGNRKQWKRMEPMLSWCYPQQKFDYFSTEKNVKQKLWLYIYIYLLGISTTSRVHVTPSCFPIVVISSGRIPWWKPA